MPAKKPRAVYIHVPFCRHRCGYCDFTLVAGRDDLIESYLKAVGRELDAVENPLKIDTLFLGGGTPSHLSPPQLERLFAILCERFRLADDCEFSIEANPADMTSERVAVFADAGVNRVSLGVQSLNDTVLKTLERDHDADVVRRATDCIRQRMENVSFDLIFGVPGQSLSIWEQTLELALALQPTHISTYGLTFEKGTAFWSRQQTGELVSVPDETERNMYAAAMDRLADAGFEHYEISNFARPEYACRHNLVYWSGDPYLAFGPGASRFLEGRRETNHRSVTGWLKRVLAGESPVMEAEQLNPAESARERLVIGLRLNSGVHLAAFFAQTGYTADHVSGEAIARHIDTGLLEKTPTHLRLTREGRFLADSVIVDLL